MVPTSPAEAQAYAEYWIAAWNARDLESILKHYAHDVVFRSPRIAVVTGDKSGVVRGIDALRAYWAKALSLAPDLRFELDRVYLGKDTVTIAYRNHRGHHVAETLVFNEAGQVAEGIVTHA